MIKTFLNHASEDHKFVFWLKNRLEKEELGLDIFVDDDKVRGGDHPKKMINEIKSSIVFLSVISNYSTQEDKEFIKNEIKVAIDNKTTNVFPIIYKCDKENIPEEIRITFRDAEDPEGIIYFDFSNEKEWELSFDDLRATLLDKIIELGFYQETDRDFYKDCEHLDIILNRPKPTSLEIKTIVDVYLLQEKYQRYVFTRLDKIEWLKWLDIYGFLKSNPPLEEDKESPGTFKIPHWYALNYLEKISIKIAENNDVENIERILNIIEKVSVQKDKNGNVIDNFHTWRYFVKILSNLPNENIKIKHLKLIPIWLESRFNNDLTGYEITKSLIPKFLNSEEPSDSKKIEKIISTIIEIREVPLSEERSKLYGKKTEEKLILDFHTFEELFDKYSDLISMKSSIRLIIDFMRKIQSLVKEEESSVFIEKNKEQKLVLKLLDQGLKYRIEVLEIDEEDDKESFENIFKKQDIKGRLLESKEIKKMNRNHFLKETFEFVTSLEVFDNINQEDIKEKLYSLFRNLYSHKTYESFYAKEHRSYSDPLDILTYIFKKILLSKANQNQEIIEKIINKFLHDKYIYFHKMALFIIGNKIDSLKSVFMKSLKEDYSTFFEDYASEDELKKILEQLGPLSEEEKEVLKIKIENGPSYVMSDDRLNKWKQKRYKALGYDNYFKEKSIKLKEITNTDVELLPSIGDVITKWGSGSSPLDKEKILSLTNKELAEYINEFKETNHFDGPTIDGLSEMLSACAQENPKKFTSDLNAFLDTSFLYIYFIFYGFRDAWEMRKEIEWEKLFEFSSKYISRKEFWEDKLKLSEGSYRDVDHKWVINIFSELIQEGVMEDSWAFEPDLLDNAEKILILIMSNLPQDKGEDDYRDAFEKSLNSYWGKTLTAYIFLILRKVRVFGKDKIDKDLNSFIGEYDYALSMNIKEAYALLGRYIQNFYYLNKKWLKTRIKIDEIYKNDICFKSYLEGYLHRNNFDLELYILMDKHLEKAIKVDFNNEHIENQLIEEICIGYLELENALKESLLIKVIDFKKVDHLISAICYFVDIVDSINDEEAQKF